jgi:hypothetical protein
MSDLQCAATFLFARPGNLSDPARDVRAGLGALSEQGRQQVHQLVEQVRSRRVAEVFSARRGAGVESAELVAAGLAVPLVPLDSLAEPSVVELAEDGVDDKRLLAEALGDIADSHRGETVLVFIGPVMGQVLGSLSANGAHPPAGQRVPPACALAALAVDADGWRRVPWPDS